MSGAQSGNQNTGSAGHANGGRHGQNHGLLHLLRGAALQGDRSSSDAGSAGAEAFHVAAGGDLAHAEQAADLQHQSRDLSNGLGVHTHVHHGADVAGVGAGVTSAGARTHTDAVVADLGAHGVHQSLIQELILKADAGTLLTQLSSHVAQQEAGGALGDAQLHSLQIVLILVHDPVEQFFTGQAGADLVFGQDDVHNASLKFLCQRNGFAHGQRHFALNRTSQIRHHVTCFLKCFD